MTREDLGRALNEAGIESHAFSLYGGTNWHDRYCLDHQGRNWLVYFAERGEQRNLRSFESEADACAYFLSWITDDPTVIR